MLWPPTGVFRVPRKSRWRVYWTTAHQWLGRTAAALAVANVYIGLGLWEKWDGSATKGYWAYSIVLGAIAIVGLTKVCLLHTFHSITRNVAALSLQWTHNIAFDNVWQS